MPCSSLRCNTSRTRLIEGGFGPIVYAPRPFLRPNVTTSTDPSTVYVGRPTPLRWQQSLRRTRPRAVSFCSPDTAVCCVYVRFVLRLVGRCKIKPCIYKIGIYCFYVKKKKKGVVNYRENDPRFTGYHNTGSCCEQIDRTGLSHQYADRELVRLRSERRIGHGNRA